MGIPDSTAGGYFGGRHLPPVRPSDLLPKLLEACGVRDIEVVEEWMRALSRVRRAPGRRPAGAPVPYRGLASFQPDDAEWFYGRRKLTDVLVEHLEGQYERGGLLMVVGPSGSGKSSLVRAGLIPAVRVGALPGSEEWPIALFTPGARPMSALASQLATPAGLDPDDLSAAMRSKPSSVSELIRQSLRSPEIEPASQAGDASAPSRRFLIVVDQFEETFTACQDEIERQVFISALNAAAEATGSAAGMNGGGGGVAVPPALVVLSLRADFYPHALRYPQLAVALQEHQVVVGSMTPAEFRSVIVEPARKAKLDIEDGLVEVLMRELAPSAGDSDFRAHDAGTLPLLSHALLTTWERARRGRLTLADYEATGGIQGAVARTAEQVYAALTPGQQGLARRMFIRLVHVADDTADTRRRVPRYELLLGQDEALQVLSCFIDKRLITVETRDAQIAHEAILLAWPRLRQWIDADREGLRIQRQLTFAAEAWRDTGHDLGTLYRGGPLVTAGEWAADPSHSGDLNDLEREFLDASLELRQAEERTARRQTLRLKRLVAALSGLVLITGFLTVFAFRQQAAATRQRNLAISRQVAIDANQLRATDVALATQLSLAAYQIAPTPEARSSLLDSYASPAVTRVLGPPGVMQSAAFSLNRHIMAAGGEDSTIRLWSIAAEGHPKLIGVPLIGHTNTVFSVVFSPDGRTLASASGDRTIRLWNVTNPGRARLWGPPITGPANTVYSLAFSPDGRILAAGSADDTVRLWNVADPRHPAPLSPPLRGPAGYVQSVAFSPDGRLLAAGSADRTVRLWSIINPRHPIAFGTPLRGPAKTIYSVTFSADGRRLAAGSADGTVWLWNIASPRHPVTDGPPLTGPRSWVNSVAFSPDGRDLAAASSDSKVWIWALPTRKVILILPHPAPVTTVVFLGDSHTLATSAADGIARIWQIPGPLISGPTGTVFTTAFSTGHHILAVVSADNTARLWNVANPRQPMPLGPIMTNVTRSPHSSGAGALSPNGQILVVGSAAGSSQIWDVRNPARPMPLGRLNGPTSVVQSIAFSPNGRLLAIADNDKTTWLWNIADPNRPALMGEPLTGPTNYVYSPVFSPDGHILAVGGADKLVHLWNISNPSRPVPINPPLAGAHSYVYFVTFSPDGRILAAAGADDEVRLWDMSNPKKPSPIGRPLAGPGNYILSLAFSSDGRTLAATAGDGSVWLWNTSATSQPQIAATLTGSSAAIFTDEYDPGRDILATGGADDLVRLWNTDPQQVTAYICSVAGDPVTKAEWAQYIPGLPYRPPCQR
jgi:WD40 repeat protein